MDTSTAPEKNQVKDRSGNRKYFTMLLRIVQIKARSPYDITAWATVMDIAGENGECNYLTEELAVLSMMSVGKFSDCRSFLIEQGLLHGYLENDDGRGNKRWHLTIPDLWEENIKIAKRLSSIKDRIKFKKEQTFKHKKTASPHEKETISPGEAPVSPHEKAVSPGETPSFIEKNLLEKPIRKDQNEEKNNFEVLLDWWYACKGEENSGLIPPKYRGKTYVQVVADHIEAGRTWKQLSEAVQIYWKIVHSKEHYYNHRFSITDFFAYGIEKFWDGKEALENFKSKVVANGKAIHHVSPPPREKYFILQDENQAQASSDELLRQSREVEEMLEKIKSGFGETINA